MSGYDHGDDGRDLGLDEEPVEPPSKTRARPLTISANRGPRPEPADYPLDVIRPKTRADCEGAARPCPFVSCRHHLYLDVHPVRGSIKLNFPDLEPDELEESCSLDVAGWGGRTLEVVGSLMNLTRERVRQLEAAPMAKLARALHRWQEPG